MEEPPAEDAGPGSDAGLVMDAGQGTADAGLVTDAGQGSTDAGQGSDAGQDADAGPARDAGSGADASTPPPAPPTVSRFQATQASIERGESVELSWEVTGATQVRIDPGLGVVSGSSVTVRPAATTTYVLRAEGAGGSREAQVTVTVTEPPPAWASLSRTYEEPGGYKSDVYRWLDSQGTQRTAVLTRNDAVDPGGSRGGMLRRLSYGTGGTERVSTGTGASGLWNGWGYVVSHYGSNNSKVSRSADVLGQYRQVFLGRHHALHEFSWDMPFADGSTGSPIPVHVTVQWLFATGRDHPVYAITFDSTAAGSKGLNTSADVRAPYGDIAWDGDGTQALVDGVRWGDKYQFFSRDEPLTSDSRWDYTQPNTVPYASAYSRTADAEMGIVQTLSWLQHNTGDSWLTANWKHTSENRAEANTFGTWTMPPNWNWPYQLCQYEMKDKQTTASKRIAWGLMAGAVGKPSYYGYGYESTASSLPYQSYSVFMVLGRPSEATVQTQVTEVEHLLKAVPSALKGWVVEQGPGGVGRSDSVRYDVAGYNGVYGAFEFKADADNAFSLRLNAAGGELHDPLFLIRDMSGPLTGLALDGVPLRADVDYFASYDDATKRVWVTLHGTWSGTRTLSAILPNP